MGTFSLIDGLVVTVVAMVVVFAVLASLWFLVELTHKLVGEPTAKKTMSDKNEQQRTSATPTAIDELGFRWKTGGGCRHYCAGDGL